MITKSDLQAGNEQFMAAERRRVGDPPTAEELLAYSRGELSAEDEQSVRERLVCHPELVRAMTEPFPAEGAESGDPDFMSSEEFAKHWALLQTRMGPMPRAAGRLLHFWRLTAAAAATAAVVLGATLWRVRSEAIKPRVAWEQQLLLPDGRRGAAEEAAPLTAQGESVLLIVSLIGPPDADRYRLEIVDVASNRSIWSSDAQQPREDDAFAILVPRRFLKPGIYQIVVYGSAGTGEERLATYSLRVPAP